jgi:type IV secretory pathway protease TraF
VPSEAAAVVCAALATAAHMACLATVSYNTSEKSPDMHFATRVRAPLLYYHFDPHDN